VATRRGLAFVRWLPRLAEPLARAGGAMVNVFLLVVTIIMTIMLALASFYFLVYFQSEDDRNVAYGPKVTVVFGLTLTAVTVLMMPLDVANRITDGGFPMETMWEVVFSLHAGMAILVVPFMLFYYEAEDPEARVWRWWTALKYEVVTCVVMITLWIVLWFIWGYAEIPVADYIATINTTATDIPFDCLGLSQFADVNGTLVLTQGGAALCTRVINWGILRLSVTPVIYLMGLCSFLGWWLFVLFVGVGLAALPIDLLIEFNTRPQPIDLQEYAKQKMILNERAQKLLEVASKLGPDGHRSQDRRTRQTYNKFKQAVYFLEKDWEKVKTAYKERGGNPIKTCFAGFLGVLSVGLSVSWIIHVLIYVLIVPPPSLMLNSLFIELDNVFALFGVIAYGLYSFYLLFCLLKGNLKAGLRFFCIPIHPMRVGATLMNSMLFNLWLLQITSFALTQFEVTAFAAYTRFTAAHNIFGFQIEYLAGFNWFFDNNIFIYLLIVICMLTGVYLLAFPSDKRALDDDGD